MDYNRNKLYFFPTSEKVADQNTRGCALSLISCGVFSLPIAWILYAQGRIQGAVFFAIIGLIAVIAAAFWMKSIKSGNAKEVAEVDKFNRSIVKITDQEIDNIAKNFLDENLKTMAIKKLGIDEDQIKEAEPIYFGGYDYDDDFKMGKESVAYKKGEDGRSRTSIYNAVIFFFSADQVYCYKVRFSLLEDVKRESSDEYFYKDIVSVSTDSEGITHNFGTEDRPNKETFSTEKFVLTTSGGTKMGATIFDLGAVEKSIQGMKSLLRSKKMAQ